MHAMEAKQIAAAIKEVALQAQKPNEIGSKGMRFHDGIGYSLPVDAAALYAEQVRRLLKYADFESKFSEEFLEKKLNSILANELNGQGRDIEGAIRNLVAECSNYKNQATVYLALEGVRASICIRIGNVQLVPGDPHLIDEVTTRSSAIINTMKIKEESKPHYRTLLRDECSKELANTCVVRCQVNAEPNRALELARTEARFVVDLLRVASKFVYPLKEDVRIGLKGERPRTRRTGFVISDSGMQTSHDSVGSVYTFEINEETTNRMDELGLLNLSDRARDGTLSDLDILLIRSIHWLSVSLTQDEPENALITLIVSLESLFKAEPGSSIGGTVAESTAFLLSKTSDGRRRISATIREFYGKRSAVAHGGKKPISDHDRGLLTQFVLSAVLVVLNDLPSIRGQSELMAWITEQKFAGGTT
jgi:hypothetical protein